MMTAMKELPPEALYKSCKSDDFKFETTAELKTSVEIPGQDRAAEAVRFGLGIERDGYYLAKCWKPAIMQRTPRPERVPRALHSWPSRQDR